MNYLLRERPNDVKWKIELKISEWDHNSMKHGPHEAITNSDGQRDKKGTENDGRAKNMEKKSACE